MRLVEGGRQRLEVLVEVAANIVLDPLPGSEHGEARAEPGHPVQECQSENGPGVDGDHLGSRAGPERVNGELDLPGNGERQARGGGEAENPRRIAGSVRTAIAE